MGRLIAVVVLLLALAVGPAWAHASLLDTTPADGAIVANAPTALTLTFNEPVSPTEMRLIGPGGAASPLGAPGLSGDTVSMSVGAALVQGSYALSWRVISADGHPVGGTVLFSVGKPSAGGMPEATEATDWPVAIGIWMSRVLTYAGLFIGVGGAFFAAWIGRTPPPRSSKVALVLGVVALPADLVFQGLDALGQPIGDAFSPAIWSEGLAASFGGFLGCAAAALGLALAGSAAGRRWARPATLLALLAVGTSFALTGHASTADPQWLTRPAVFLHTIAVTFWIGSLLPLAGLLRADAEAALPALERFTAVIPGVIAVLLVAGIALATIQVAAPAELLTSAYGAVFLAKMVLVIGLLGFAAYNRWWLTAPAQGEAPPARRRLARVIVMELGLACLVLCVVALWRFTPPPRALLQAAAVPAVANIMQDDGMAEISVRPGHAGPVAVQLRLYDAAMKPLAAQQVTVDFSNKDAGIQPIERQALQATDGSWRVDRLELPVGGSWQIEIDGLVSTFRVVVLNGTLTLRP